ncbi:MAG: hypothetical protein JWP78_2667 [Mucilaginibacter sp.]|nr:hypothetical protein [Mucilaginibacter sp.]
MISDLEISASNVDFQELEFLFRCNIYPIITVKSRKTDGAINYY